MTEQNPFKWRHFQAEIILLVHLYRAVDSEGNTLEFLLRPTRDAEAAKRFFGQALHVTMASTPQTLSSKGA